MRWLLLFTVAFGLAAGAWFLGRAQLAADAAPTVVERLRAVSRLQVLDVSVTRKVTLRPGPVEQPTLTGALRQWAQYAVAPPSGTALVAAEAHFTLDLSRLGPDAVTVVGSTVELALPEPEVSVELQPAATEVLTSNLDSQQTTALLASAQTAFAASLARDPRLQERAREAGRRSLSALVLSLGFKEVRFAEPGGAVAQSGTAAR